MLGHETQATGTAPADDRRRDALADALGGVRERLEGIARALGALRGDIDRVLEGPAEGPPAPTPSAK